MNKQKFIFEDDIQTQKQDIQNNTSQIESQLQEEINEPTKIQTKKRIKKKTKIKKIKRRKKSWVSTLFIFILILVLIASICIGGYFAYEYYRKQENRINELKKQIETNQQNIPSYTPDNPKTNEPEDTIQDEDSNTQKDTQETNSNTSENISEDNQENKNLESE